VEELHSRLLVDGLVFGEGPRWRDGWLWLSDMHGHRVLRVDLAGRIEDVVAVPEQPSGLGWLPDGRLLVVSMRDYRLLRLEGGRLVTHADLRPFCTGTPNDMVVDARGRAYVGNFGFDALGGAEPRPADLVLVEPGGGARAVAGDLSFPNGSVLAADGRTLIVAETFGNRLTAFDVDPESGALSGRRVFAELGSRDPDGIALDAEGCVWISSFGTGEFLRVREGGEITHRIAAEAPCAVACALGGPDGGLLFLLTADTTLEDLAHGRSKGCVRLAEAPCPHAGPPGTP
jgi:sugar lactone lactonase YvrE